MSSQEEMGIAVQLLPSSMPRGEYAHVIRFPDVRGKTVLDIGSGSSDCVKWLNSNGAKAYGIDVRYADLQVLRSDVDVSFSRVKKRIMAYKKPEHEKINHLRAIDASRRNFEDDIRINPGRYLASFASRLPFTDESFDFVFSLNCITHGLDRDYSVLENCVNDALRVLKPGGELQLYPFLGSLDKRLKKNHEKLVSAVRKAGYAVEVENATPYYSRLVVSKH